MWVYVVMNHRHTNSKIQLKRQEHIFIYIKTEQRKKCASVLKANRETGSAHVLLSVIMYDL